MENTEKWDEAESIQLIRSMIESTKYKIYSDRFIYLLWGYSVLGCALIHYLLEFMIGFQNPSLVWMAMPLVSVAHFVFINKRKTASTGPTFTGRVMAGIWTGMFFAIIALLIGSFRIGWDYTYPFFMLLYGLAGYTTGVTLQYKYLVWGALASMICGVLAFFQPFQYQLLLLMVAIGVSYILPAHLMGSLKK